MKGNSHCVRYLVLSVLLLLLFIFMLGRSVGFVSPEHSCVLMRAYQRCVWHSMHAAGSYTLIGAVFLFFQICHEPVCMRPSKIVNERMLFLRSSFLVKGRVVESGKQVCAFHRRRERRCHLPSRLTVVDCSSRVNDAASSCLVV